MKKILSIFFLILLPAIISLGASKKPGTTFSVKKKLGGIASYYHDKFNGRKTSSGEIFSNDSLTAAHKTLPLGTWVKVTNLKNELVVTVKINDRLPKRSKRTIDLSSRAAKQLNFINAGLTKVKIEILEVLSVKNF